MASNNHRAPEQVENVLTLPESQEEPRNPWADVVSDVSATGAQSDDEDGESEQEAPRVFATASSYKRGVEIELSTGEWVRLRPRSLMTMLRMKKVPNSLVPAAQRMLTSRGTTQGMNAQQIAESLELNDFLVCELVASMKVVRALPEDCADDEVSCLDLFDADKNLIANAAMRGQQALSSFRQ